MADSIARQINTPDNVLKTLGNSDQNKINMYVEP